MRLGIGAIVAVAAALLLVAGLLRTHQVYAKTDGEQEDATLESVSDRALVRDATFSGVLRKDGQLYSTYDRTAPQGKQSCPT